MTVAIAIVGAGRMGRWHADAATRAGADVVAIVDEDARAAGSLAARVPARADIFSDLATCLHARRVAAVHVCAPTAAHYALTSVALESGCHVIVEKPLAASPAETEDLLATAERRGVVLAAVHQFPFQRGVRRLLRRRASLGELVRVAYRTSSAGWPSRPPAERRALLSEIAPHAASLFHRFAPGFDPAALEIELAGESLAVAGWAGTTRLEAFVSLTARPPCNELVLTGTRRSAVADLFHGYAVVEGVPATGVGKAFRPVVVGTGLAVGALANAGRLAVARELAYPGLRDLVRAFYKSVGSSGPSPVSPAELRAAAALRERVDRGLAVLQPD